MTNVKAPAKQRRTRRKQLPQNKTTATMRQVAKQEIAKKSKQVVERMYLTVDEAGTIGPIGDVTPELLNLTSMSDGPEDNERTGVKATLKKLRLNIHFQKGANSLITQTCRMIIFKWNESEIPGETDLLSPSPLSGIQQQILAQFFRNRSGLVLIDDIFTVYTQGPAAYDREYEIPLNGMVNFTGTGGASARKGGVYALLVSDFGPRGSASPIYRLSSRVTYTDQ